ncbi:putative quinol monooxygenase [Sphingomonas yantingensis]|uniref:Quinol monooxygenase YgiN n=1 Tax=Sphingomonas yantingensis TaxID=1241761 RepID=A0A7W9AT23_9SPHN|nr:putative quinol monooxygenase [Sphingomonas yantingensis]MBB5699829.1 quinol monooxygenase YgiN [Sphingomonas yantingensis]
MPTPVKIVAILTARPGKEANLRTLLDSMLAPSRGEPGNHRYDLWTDPTTPGRFVLDELYADADAVAAHRATPHFQAYLSQIEALAGRQAFVLDPAAVA